MNDGLRSQVHSNGPEILKPDFVDLAQDGGNGEVVRNDQRAAACFDDLRDGFPGSILQFRQVLAIRHTHR